ncbi:MAG: hypothetical protein C0595_07360 [Marinilabiliales bacterium]|nr:MAG: hypothetical protein C0595_07360 [Marinilabiliales bacterium]
MKLSRKFFISIIVLVFAISISACSNGLSKHKYRAKRNQSTINPVSTKDTPVRKKYIIKQKNKKILGQQDPL